MLSQFRTLAKTPVAKVLFLVLGASFVLWGIRGVAQNVSAGNAVVKAGSRTVDAARFRQMFDDELRQYSQQSGQQITAQDALAHNLDRQVADAVASDESFAEYVSRAGVRPADKLVVDEIRKAPRFFSPVSGVFDREAYEQFVRQVGMTDRQFEALLRDQLAQAQFVSGVASGLRAPLMFSALEAAYEQEGRNFSYVLLGPGSVPAPAKPTDAQLQAFIKENAARLMQPEARVFTLLRFSTQQQIAKTTVDPAAVQKRFDFEKDSLSTPEKRSVFEMPVKDQAQGQQVAAKLKGGADPMALAKSLGVQPLNYTDEPKTAIADRKLADAAFSMSSGQVQGPLQGDLGLAVLKVGAITPGHAATLDEVRARIEAEVKHDAAQSAVDQQVRKYEDARSGGANLLQAAKTVNAQTADLPAVTAQGRTRDLPPKPVPMPEKLLQAGFKLAPGADTDLIDLGQGEYAALHLVKVLPSAPFALDAVRPLVTQVVMQRDLMTRLNAKADAMMAQMKKGQSLEAAAAAAGVQVQHAQDVTREAANKTYSNELLSAVFNGRPGDVVSGPDTKPGVLVAKIEGTVPAEGRGASQLAANDRPQVTQGVSQALALSVRTAMRDAIKPKVDYARARAALGGDQSGAQ